MADLTTSYMGLKLRNPIIVGSSGLTDSISGIKRCEEAGVGAVVLKSVFEEQFLFSKGISEEDANIYPEALDYLRQGGLIEYGPHEYAAMIESAKKEVSIPLIASVNCQTPKLWPSFAKQIDQAGADALELNIYLLPIDPVSPSLDYEESHLKIFQEVKKKVSIPVSVKLNPQMTSIPHLGKKLAEAGCSALVLFNWFLEPDIDVEKLKTRSRKGKANFFQSLRWIALISGRVGCDVAASGGIQGAKDVVKQILAGADAVQICSLFYQKGVEEAQNILVDLEAWMNEHQYGTLQDFQGELSFKKQELRFRDLGEAEAYFRAQYLKAYGGID
jgi:dihydroorotate dehydrogenase (fumarate)